jgi:hypothetical protein
VLKKMKGNMYRTVPGWWHQKWIQQQTQRMTELLLKPHLTRTLLIHSVGLVRIMGTSIAWVYFVGRIHGACTMKVCVLLDYFISTVVHDVLCNLIMQVHRLVLTCCGVSTYRESCGGEQEFQKQCSGLCSLCRFWFHSSKRVNFDDQQYGVGRW